MEDFYGYLALMLICVFVILQILMHIKLGTVLNMVRESPPRSSFWTKISWLKNQYSSVDPPIQSKIAFLVRMRAALVAIVVIVFLVYAVANIFGSG